MGWQWLSRLPPPSWSAFAVSKIISKRKQELQRIAQDSLASPFQLASPYHSLASDVGLNQDFLAYGSNGFVRASTWDLSAGGWSLVQLHGGSKWGKNGKLNEKTEEAKIQRARQIFGNERLSVVRARSSNLVKVAERGYPVAERVSLDGCFRPKAIDFWTEKDGLQMRGHSNAKFEATSDTGFERGYHSVADSEPTVCVNECSQGMGEAKDTSNILDADYGPSASAIARARASVSEIGQLLLRSSPIKKGQSVASKDERLKSQRVISRSIEDADSYLTQARFDEYDVSPLSVKALHTVLGYERMTAVQEATLPVILEGKDVVAKAKTGAGKTIAFLLPAIEVILEACPNNRELGSSIYAVIVCPTRELAQQVTAEARTLLQFHTGFGAQVLTGGFSVSKEQKFLQTEPCQILVATPGRLVDHMERTEGFKQKLKSVKLLILDEADHVLDMGFRKSLEQIIQFIPTYRQTLLFSATIPKEVHSMSKVALKEDYVFIDTVGNDSLDTHAKVKQKYIVAPVEKHLGVLYSVLKEHIKQEPNYKVLVFCATARITAFMSQLYKDLGFSCREIHSKKSQMYRTHAYNEFRNSEGSIILFTSDVSARGVDYPNVTLVIQVGVPDHGGKYIHRLGRTGRVGKEGEGLLLLAPWEGFFLAKIQNQPIEEIPVPKLDAQIESKILSTLSSIDSEVRLLAYQTWLGYYKSLKGLGIDKPTLVSYANQFSCSIGFDTPPALRKSVISKMALGGVPGLRRQ